MAGEAGVACVVFLCSGMSVVSEAHGLPKWITVRNIVAILLWCLLSAVSASLRILCGCLLWRYWSRCVHVPASGGATPGPAAAGPLEPNSIHSDRTPDYSGPPLYPRPAIASLHNIIFEQVLPWLQGLYVSGRSAAALLLAGRLFAIVGRCASLLENVWLLFATVSLDSAAPFEFSESRFISSQGTFSRFVYGLTDFGGRSVLN